MIISESSTIAVSWKSVSIILSFILYLGFASGSFADEYYVTPTGEASWPLCSNELLPCSPTVAMENAIAGDIVYFRGGKYELYYDESKAIQYYWFRGILNPSNSGNAENPITFMAYPGETPVLNGHTNADFTDMATVLGNGTQDYIVYDGFVVMADNGEKMGSIVLAGNEMGRRTIGHVIKNFTFNGGTTHITTTDNREGLRIEQASNILVQNSIFFNFRQVDNWPNTSAIKLYDDDHIVFEHLEIYDSTVAIFIKSNIDDSIVRNSFLHNNANAILGQVYLDKDSDNIAVYNNVVTNNTRGGIGVIPEEQATADGWIIYNNTIYNSGTGIAAATGDWKIWNNIIVDNADTSIWRYANNVLVESDHNQFGDTLKIISRAYTENATTYTSLAAWQTSTDLSNGSSPGTGSFATTPGFENASTNLQKLNDFRVISDNIRAGRDGGNIGANIDNVGVVSTTNANKPGKIVIISVQ